jgi:hypothetical protein
MRVRPSHLCLFLITACLLPAADLQGVVIDRNCAQDILKNGRRNVFKRRPDCSLMKNYSRAAYGILTDDHKFFSFDDAGNKQAVRLLENTPDKDNLKIITRGEIDGDTIKVATMSLL